MINLKKGCSVPFPEKLYEQYQKIENGYIANVNAEKITEALKEFVKMQQESVFFFLEVPSSLDDETVLEGNVLDGTHKDVYYMEELDEEEAFIILDVAGEVLVNDGLVSFGFGAPEKKDEIISGKYNVVEIYSADDISYDALFEKLEVPKTEKLVTAWDTFSIDTPGTSDRFEADGKDVYSIIKEFEPFGLYFAERRENS